MVEVRTRKPPTLIVVVAIIQIVIGSLSLCGSVIGLARVPQMLADWQVNQTKIPGQRNATDTEAEMIKRIPWFQEYTLGKAGLSGVLSLMMIVGGIGLLKMQRWAWTLTVVYCLSAMVFHIADTVITVTTIGPVIADVTVDNMNAQMKAMPQRPGAPPPPDMGKFMKEFMPVAMIIGGIIGLMFALLYPITMLVLVSLRFVREAFRDEPMTDQPLEDRMQPEG